MKNFLRVTALLYFEADFGLISILDLIELFKEFTSVVAAYCCTKLFLMVPDVMFVKLMDRELLLSLFLFLVNCSEVVGFRKHEGLDDNKCFVLLFCLLNEPTVNF